MAYWYQIQAVSKAGASDVLEIGRGTGVVSDYLRGRLGLNVTSFDLDEALEPDVVGDVRRLDDFFEPDSFDAVCAFQVLEHLPFEDFRPTLEKMAAVAKKYVVISLPHWGSFLHFRLWISRWQFVFGRKIARPHTWRFDGQHH